MTNTCLMWWSGFFGSGVDITKISMCPVEENRLSTSSEWMININHVNHILQAMTGMYSILFEMPNIFYYLWYHKCLSFGAWILVRKFHKHSSYSFSSYCTVSLLLPWTSQIFSRQNYRCILCVHYTMHLQMIKDPSTQGTDPRWLTDWLIPKNEIPTFCQVPYQKWE